MNAANNEPVVILPLGPFIVSEDEELAILGARVSDIDMEVAANYELAVKLSVQQGVVTLHASDGLSFSVGDGVEDEWMYFHGPAMSVAKALGRITYRGHLNWWVTCSVDKPDDEARYWCWSSQPTRNRPSKKRKVNLDMAMRLTSSALLSGIL